MGTKSPEPTGKNGLVLYALWPYIHQMGTRLSRLPFIQYNYSELKKITFFLQFSPSYCHPWAWSEDLFKKFFNKLKNSLQFKKVCCKRITGVILNFRQRILKRGKYVYKNESK